MILRYIRNIEEKWELENLSYVYSRHAYAFSMCVSNNLVDMNAAAIELTTDAMDNVEARLVFTLYLLPEMSHS